MELIISSTVLLLAVLIVFYIVLETRCFKCQSKQCESLVRPVTFGVGTPENVGAGFIPTAGWSDINYNTDQIFGV